MATVKPFKAIRPDAKYADKVISLPYDVMNRKESAEMAADNPYSFLHICRAEIDLPEQENAYDQSVYEKARDNIAERLASGVFVQEDKPALYIYRQIMDGRVQTGIVGCVAVDEYQNNTIKKHEFTRVEKEKDRINHFDVCDADTEPVFLTYRDDKRIRTIVEGYVANHEPEYDITSDDGIQHTLWVVDDPELVKSLTGLFDEIPALYIADGHHRSASACKVGLKRREEHPDYTGDEEFNFFMAVAFPDDQLRVLDYNRLVKDLNGYTKESFLEELSKIFDITDDGSADPHPSAKHECTMYLDKSWYTLRFKEGMIDESSPVTSLDVSALQERVLAPLLGIKDPRTDMRIAFVGGIKGSAELQRRVDSGEMSIAFELYPVSVREIMSVADAGMIMPPKSTWFEPKLGSGWFIHRI